MAGRSRPASHKTRLKPNPAGFQGENRPIERVTWDDAIEFCQRLEALTGRPYSLPSEAEWEYACRAGTSTPFHFGETLTPDLANYNSDYVYSEGPKGRYRSETTPVGFLGFANAFGLSDMHGNVWEWCQDPWHDNYEGAPTHGDVWWNQPEEDGRRVIRGGSWCNPPKYCRSASRGYDSRDNTGRNLGFRVVCRDDSLL
jgi:formylglycine-generating enzyme required for sulfatase activity